MHIILLLWVVCATNQNQRFGLKHEIYIFIWAFVKNALSNELQFYYLTKRK